MLNYKSTLRIDLIFIQINPSSLVSESVETFSIHNYWLQYNININYNYN